MEKKEFLESINHLGCVLNIPQKPIGLLNVNGFYDNLLSFLDHAVEQNFFTSST
jgi:predicted Rossmann-fold nucleotide-binding protein